MKEKVFKINRYRVGYRVDKQLIISLQDIFEECNKDHGISITVECANDTKYIFESSEEFFRCIKKKPYRIIKISIYAYFGSKLDGNSVELIFDNGRYPNVEIIYNFDDSNAYLVLKNKIENCLNNFKLSYRLFSRAPLIAIISTIVVAFICVYTSERNIVFPTWLQYSIIYFWGFLILLSLVSPYCIVKIKRDLFPCVEFNIGQNERIEKKNAKIRNFILVTVFTPIIIGVIVNFISNFLKI